MTTISIRCKMNDYGAFKQAYDGWKKEYAADMGIVASSVYRNLDDPDFVTVHHQFTDETAAKAAATQWNSDGYREASRQHGWSQVDTMEVTLLQDAE